MIRDRGKLYFPYFKASDVLICATQKSLGERYVHVRDCDYSVCLRLAKSLIKNH